MSHQTDVAVAAAHQLKKRGPVIVMHARPDWVWSFAMAMKSDANRHPVISESVKLVQDFLFPRNGKWLPAD